MNHFSPPPSARTLPDLPRCSAVALLIDGRSISASQAGRCLRHAQKLGALGMKHVYGDNRSLSAWRTTPGFRTIHTHTGPNVTDTRMRVEAVQLALTGAADGIVLASDDGELVPVALALRARGIPVLGLVGPAAPPLFRQSCTICFDLPPAPTTPRGRAADPVRAAVLAALCGRSLTVAELGHAMARHGHATPEGNCCWETYLHDLGPRVLVSGEGETRRFSLAC